MTMQLRPYQHQAVEAVYEHLRTREDNPCVVLPTGCHAPGHPILMHDGTLRRVEDIRVGDEVMGPDSRPRRVVALCRGEDAMFRIVPHRGESFVVNGDHVLSLVSTNENKPWPCNRCGGEVEHLTVREYLAKAKSWRHLRKLYRVPVDFQSQHDLPVPPYILGLLLGDGCLRDVVELTTADEVLADVWQQYAQSIGSDTSVDARDGRCPTYTLQGIRGRANILTEALDALGLAGTDSASKFIPHRYLTARRMERLNLLAGLMDTDGSVNKSGFEITTKSLELATDIVFLARSLGLAAGCRQKYSYCQTGAGGWFFRVHIFGDGTEVPCRLSRKRPSPRRQKKSVLRTGFQVEPLEPGPFFGFTLDGDHRYVDGHFVVHHNSGKTPVLATICKDAVTRWQGRVLILAHVKELLEQAAEKLQVICPEVRFGVYSAGLKRRDTEHSVIVAGIQSVHKKACELDAFDLVIVDECCPAGTLVATPTGPVPIETVHAGDIVLNAMGTGEVLATSARPAHDLRTLEFSDGTRLTCTAGHPVFTDRGWVVAGSLEVGAVAIGIEDLRALQEGIQPVEQDVGRREREGHAGAPLETAAFLFALLRQEAQQPDGHAGNAARSQLATARNQASTVSAGREWQTSPRVSAGDAFDSGSIVDSGVRCPHADAAGTRLADALQDRLGESRDSRGHRNRRPLPRFPHQAGAGSPEDSVLGGKRLVRITHHEPASPVVVYNLHVAGHPSYFADGILVHNCHLIPEDGEGMYRQFLAEARVINPAVRVIGLTATPFRLKSGRICSPENILNAVCYEVGVRELIRDGYLCPLVTKAGREKAEVGRLHVRGGEFVAGEVEDLMDQDRLVVAACREIVQCTADRTSVLIFASGVKHAEHVQRVLQEEHHLECGLVSGQTPASQRDALLARFRRERSPGLFPQEPLKYLVNVNVLTTGFDAPNIDCVALLRPTMSPGLYCQMTGRGFRLHAGKQDCLVLDFGGNVLRHGPVDQINVGEVASHGPGEAPAKECPECRSVIAAGYAVCPDCGYQFPPPERQRHDAKASQEGILSGQVTDTEYEVRDISYRVHTKRDAPPGAPKTMRVDYRLGLNHWQSEFICFEHDGYARQKAEAWWRQRSPDPVPETAERAMEIAEGGGLAIPTTITVRSIAGEKYDRIVGCQLGSRPEPLVTGPFDAYTPDEIPF